MKSIIPERVYKAILSNPLKNFSGDFFFVSFNRFGVILLNTPHILLLEAYKFPSI